jgi:uncharacterized protein YdaU (DUF1376 family)
MSMPYFPMFPTDFEADTSHLTLAEDGAYNRLLRLVWMTSGCSLPDDDAWILRRMRCQSDADRTIVLGVVDEFFTRSNGRVSNARLTREFEKTKEAHEKRVSAGSKGGKAKSLKSLEAVYSNAKAKLKQPEPEPEPISKRDTNASPKKVVRLFSAFWETFPHRNGKKANKSEAERKYRAAIRSGVSEETIIDSATAYRSDPDVLRNYGRGPVPWLNQKGWEDEPAANPVVPIHGETGKPNHAEDFRRRFAAQREAREGPGGDHADAQPFRLIAGDAR